MEEQQAAAATTPSQREFPLSSGQAAKQRQQEGLLLSRKRILQQFETVQNARHREMLEHALSALDAQLARLG